jgi:hypothetical protein
VANDTQLKPVKILNNQVYWNFDTPNNL